MYKRWVLLFLMVACSFPSGAWAQEKPYTFGIAPIYDPQVIEEGYNPIMRYLSEFLKAPVKLLITESYEALTEKLKNGEVDFALLGPVQYVQTKERYPELVYLATSQTTKFGQKRAYYFGHILAHKDSDITNISDLEGKTFAFVNKQTTSGYSFPI
jgi:phosphonate transport system substrate-binding protein